MNKKTLYVTFDGLTDPLGQSQILPYIMGIAKQGYSITILSCEKKERLGKEEKLVLELIKNSSITWKYILYNEQGSFFSRFLYIKKIKSIAEKLHKQHPFKLLHCRSYLSSLIGLRFKLKYDVPFVFDMRGFWADERIDGNIWQISKPLHRLFYNYFKKKEKEYIKQSSAIVSLTNNAVKELTKQHPQEKVEQKTTVIPCCCNTDLFNKSTITTTVNVQNLSENDHVIIYTGSVGTWYFTREMVDCILVWKNYIPNIKLLIVTKDKAAAEAVINKYPSDVSRVIIITSSSYNDIPKYLNLAKAAMFFIKPSYSKIASSPTKMAECWAMNLPIITNSGIGDNDICFKNNLGGILINHFNTGEYENACKSYLKLITENNNYRDIALNHFDTKDAVIKYTKIYTSLSNN